MNIYFDTEFTGLHKNTTLISLGMVADNGKSFYAEFTDYDQSQCDDWIKENVIENLSFNDSKFFEACESVNHTLHTTIKGNKSQIKRQLLHWLKDFDKIQFVSDVCHYDFVLLIDLFGTAFDLPSSVNPACHDINQDIACHYGITEKEAFDKSREEIVSEYDITIDGDKHNALYDARVIQKIYEVVQESD